VNGIPKVQGIHVWHAPEFPGLLFYRGTEVNHSYPRHWHDELSLCFYTSGSGYLGYRGSSHRIVAGDFIATPAGEVHSNWVEKQSSVSFRSLYVDLRQLRAHTEQLTGGDHAPAEFSSLQLRDRPTQQSFLRMHRAMEFADSPLLREELSIEFFHRLITGCSDLRGHRQSAGRERSVVERVRRYIDEHSAEPISLAELATVARLSPFHLHRVFCQETGMPPHSYQTQVRINRAKELLRQYRTLPEIALATGFSDQSHFTRHFRRLVGVTPGRFRAH
jgi:AraC-like DNA-binding protein